MHIFITGIAGFLGSHLAERCLSLGHTVSGCDNLVGGDLENIKDLNVKFYNANCENLEEMTKVMKGAEILCHSAAYAHEGLSNVSPKLICENNVVGSTSVFTAAIKNNIKRIVFCSSMARYGNNKTPFSEHSDPKPVDPYGVSKVAAENILKILSETYKFEYNIAIPHNIVGTKQKYDDAFRNVASIMINLMLQNRKPIIYGDGNQKRCFSDIDDCLNCLEKLLFDPNIVSETVNIGPDEEFITINELFQKISNKLQFNKGAEYHKNRPNEVVEALCSSEKARKILGYKTTKSLDESLNEMIDFIKKRGVRKFKYNYEIEIENDDVLPKTWKEKLF